MANSPITARIDALLAQKGIDKKTFYHDCGITSASYSQWNTQKTTPKPSNLYKIAKYLDTTYIYLTTGVEGMSDMLDITASYNGSFLPEIKKEPPIESGLSETKQKLIDIIRADDMDEEQAAAWLSLIEKTKK